MDLHLDLFSNMKDSIYCTDEFKGFLSRKPKKLLDTIGYLL